jgi:hypothetical protein
MVRPSILPGFAEKLADYFGHTTALRFSTEFTTVENAGDSMNKRAVDAYAAGASHVFGD